MKGIIFCLMVIGLISYGQTTNKNNTSNSGQESNMEMGKKTDNALAFINGYIENVNKMNKAVGIIDWVNSNKLSTDGFKQELNRLIEEGNKKDPELGLDSDPILDAQDNPDKGFVIESFDEKTNYLTLKGIDWPDFKLTMKIKNESGTWLVDGCGIINIPNEKRANR